MSLEFELSISAAEPSAAGGNVTARYSKGMRMGAFSLAAIGEIVTAMTGQLSHGQPDGAWMEQAGAALFDALLTGPILDAWRECRTLAAAQKTGVRLRLYTDQPDVMAVPWEYLFDHQNNRWLALDADISLVRGLPLAARDPQPVQGILRVLVMISSPTDLDALDTEQEWASLDEATGGAALELIRVAPTYAALQSALRQHQPHIFHYIGHGESAEQGYLLLCDPDGAAERVGGDRLVPLLAATPSLGLIFLNACQGSTPATATAFSSLAQQLLQQQIPAVLAMQTAIADRDALAFSREFYRALADGLGAESAVSQGRLAIHQNAYTWGVPTFYFQSNEPFALPPQSPQEKATRLWQKVQSAQGERLRGLIRQVLEQDPTHAGAREAQARWEREAEAIPLYAAAEAYIQHEQWRDAHRTLTQIERMTPNFRQSRSLLAEVLGHLRGQPPANSSEQSAQYEQYGPILSALQAGRLVPFLGWDVGRIGRPAGDAWVRGQYLPDPSETAQELFLSLGGAVEGLFSLSQVSQYTSLLEGEPALYDRLSALYNGDYRPTLLHRLLAEMPGRLGRKGYPTDPNRRFVIFSVAFDDLLERAFDEVGQPYHLFAYRHRSEDSSGVAQPGRFVHLPPGGAAVEVLSPNDYGGLGVDRHPVIVKLCGRVISAEPDSVMVTEDQYLAYLPAQDFGALLPATLLSEVNRRSFLFFGYSLQPWPLRLLWQRMRYQGRRLHSRSWAIAREANTIEREFWRSQDIVPIVAQPEGVVAYLNQWLETLEARI